MGGKVPELIVEGENGYENFSVLKFFFFLFFWFAGNGSLPHFFQKRKFFGLSNFKFHYFSRP